MILNRVRVATRLGLSFGGLLVLFSMVTGFAVVGLGDSVNAHRQQRMHSSQVALASNWAHATQLNVNRVLGIARSGNSDAVNEHFTPLIAQTTEKINAYQKNLESTIEGPQAKQAFQAVGEARVAYIAQRKAYFDTLAKDSELAKRALETGLSPAAERYMQLQGAFVSTLETTLAAEAKEAEKRVEQTTLLLMVLAGCAFLFGGIVAWFMVRSITKPVDKALEASKRIAEGNLSQDIDVVCKDEFGTLLRSMQGMQESLREMVRNIRQSSNTLAASSSEIASGGMDLSARTEQAAASLEETAASMEELTVTVAQSAGASREANIMASEAAGMAAKGGQAMEKLAAKMGDIESSGKRIADIIGVIDGIAFQTNILALNAAVEAARAGEQGRGFAVVATEVRSLAKRSADAAKEIKALIQTSVGDIQSGSQQVRAAASTMDQVVSSVRTVSEMVAQITLSAGEQSSGIAQVNQAVAHLDQMTQQNAALVEESSAAADGLREQAARLGETVALFRT